MEIYHLTVELSIVYVTASSFPDGIDDAFYKLKRILPDSQNRTLFGISKPDEDGEIIYKAGALVNFPGEARRVNLNSFILEAGDYLCKTINDWEYNTTQIADAFMNQLLKHPRLDPKTYCIEWYKGNDVMCMVKMLS